MARSSAVVNAAGPSDQRRSRGLSASGMVETGKAIRRDSRSGAWDGVIILQAQQKLRALVPSSMTLLVLPAGATGAGIVASDSGNCRRCPTHRTHRTVHCRSGHRGLRRGNSTGGPGKEVVGPDRRRRGCRWRSHSARLGLRPGRLGADLDLQEPLGKGGVNVVHQVFEHLEGLALVLYQRVFLTPGAVLDGVPKLIQVVKMILPPLVQH